MHLLAFTACLLLVVKMSEGAVAVGVGRLNPGETFEKNEMRIARARMNYVNNSMRILSNNFVDFTEYETFTF